MTNLKRLWTNPVCFTLGCLIISFLVGTTPLRAGETNILFIAIDDLKPALGVYGSPVMTPAMDSLAGEGIVFLNAHCQQAVCGPSRASLLTGLRPDTLGIYDLKTKMRKQLPEVLTLPQHFKNHGYRTAGVGKIFDPRNVDSGMDGVSWTEPFAKSWKLPFYDPETGPPAAAHYHSPRIHELDRQAIEASGGDWKKRMKFLQDHDAWPAWERLDVPDHAYQAAAIADQGIAWLEEFEAAREPFFIAVGFMKPHLPFVAPEKYWQLYDPADIDPATVSALPEGAPVYAGHTSYELRPYTGIPKTGPLPEDTQRTLIHAYYATVSYVDAQIGRLLKALDQSGAAENTVIVLWGDHGFHLGDHGLWCKHSNYEQATRVPLILKGPGVPTGERAEYPVGLVDIFPTLCEVAGVAVPEELEGTSLLRPETERPRKLTVSQYPRPGKMGYALRTRDLRYVAWFEISGKRPAPPAAGAVPVAEELYDYTFDPLETRNRIEDDAYGERVSQLRAQLDKLLN